MAITLTTYSDQARKRTSVAAHIDDALVHEIGPRVLALVLEKIAQGVADEYLKTHLQDVLAAIDVQAVANLAVADSAAAIRDTVDVGVRKIHEDMGAVTHAVNRPREVLIPGWFGVKRGVVR